MCGRAQWSIRDAARHESDWDGRHTILRGDSANLDMGGRTCCPADWECPVMMPSGLDAGFIFGLAPPPAEFAHHQGAPWSNRFLIAKLMRQDRKFRIKK
jgi:hypothetical protein